MGGRVNSGLHLDGVSKQAGLPRIMFDSLSEKLQSALGGIRNQGRLNEKDIDKVSREIRLALLEADVNYKVVKDFVRKVKVRAMDAEVLKSLNPAQQVIKVVNEELTALMGSSSGKLEFSSRPPTVIMLVGLQGSGKTTACWKRARFLVAQVKKPRKVASHVDRPAASTTEFLPGA